MSQLVNYSIIEAGLRALADKAHESAVAQAEGKPIPCGLSEGDMELVALLTAMMNDTQANKGWCAHEMGKSISSFEKYVHDGSIINTIGHELLHVVSHICEQDGIDMLGEEPCYMMGSLCEKFFKVYD